MMMRLLMIFCFEPIAFFVTIIVTACAFLQGVVETQSYAAFMRMTHA